MLGSIWLLGDSLPDELGMMGISFIVFGMILNSMIVTFSKKSEVNNP
ncbi:hypothetical protein LBYZC6_33660 [Lacrimispora brassicae]